MQLGNTDTRIQMHIQESAEWNEWQATALQDRNMVENVYRWACGRPTSIHDRNRDSDEDDINHDRDYDVAPLANNLSQAFRYNVYDNDEGEEGHGTLGRDDEEGYFDNESAEVVISSLRLGDDQGNSNLFTNSNWFAFQDDNTGDTATSPEAMVDVNLNTGGTENEEDLFADRPIPEWVGWEEPSNVSDPVAVSGPEVNPFEDYNNTPGGDVAFEEEGIVEEAGALKRKVVPGGGGGPEKESVGDSKEFNDSNYWRVDQEIAVSE
ncbi:hypothetical protein LXL04_008399 [Taraxacum kok-saghyz]